MEKAIMAIRNKHGLEEINYLLSLSEFRSLFASDCDDKSWFNFITSLDDARKIADITKPKSFGGWTDFYLTPNDSLLVAYVPSEKHAKSFLYGAYNESVDRMVSDNWNPRLSIDENISEYINWYWWVDTRESNKDLLKKFSNMCNPVTSARHYEMPIDVVLELYDGAQGEEKKALSDYIKNYRKVCSECGRELEIGDPNIPGRVLETAYNISEWYICCDCMEEHCKETKCLKCDYLDSGVPAKYCSFRKFKEKE